MGEIYETYLVTTSDSEVYEYGSLEAAEKAFQEMKSDYDDFTGDERLTLSKVIKVAYVVEDKERMKKENPKDSGYDGWVKWEEQQC
ncbi:hypothetical protein ACFFJY_09200 [Fictibacillus aquaticus]|uniref:Phage protein n=1 Tax=Fictibacillus aquaticus TaxID=2021314 RepID=A0A235FBQ3_9BACL|nr:hypothetical protein [Fictibacillus aquaticus]OYD58454.1 hypothetical protein CGZ90_00705 [Fictibacillus aquaticus]